MVAAPQTTPGRIAPMLATPGTLPRDQDAWAFEVKWDGVRCIATAGAGAITLSSRSGRDITAAYPELQPIADVLGDTQAVLDGEIIAFDENGRQSFQAVQQRINVTAAPVVRQLAAATPVTYMIFDLLALGDEDLTPLTYQQRRERLGSLGLGAGENWDVPPYYRGAGTTLMQATGEHELEGIIAKRLDSPYQPGTRAPSWLKIKHGLRQEVVIGGYTPGRGARAGTFGALQVGIYDDTGEHLHYAGGVGTGFSDAVLREIRDRLDERRTPTTPFNGTQPPAGTRFVRPGLVCEVAFSEWTADGRLRHPTFRGLRSDKPAAEVVREPEPPPPGAAGPPGAHPDTNPDASSPAHPHTPPPPAIDGDAIEVDGRRIKLSNLDKVLYPQTGTTKREVITYYAQIAPALLPHLRGRPVTLKRYPDGVDGKSFFQKRAAPHRPDWVSTVTMPSSRHGEIQYVEIGDTATLLWAAQLAAIELHPSLSLAAHPERPTALVFDLDPGAPATIVECCAVAQQVRSLLTELDLQCWAKTSGSKGLQLYAPLNMEATYDATKPFAQAVATLLEQRHPGEIVSRMKKSLRPGKVLIDWSQNDQNKTTVSAYAMRARPEPTVSTPVTWDEVERCEATGDPGLLRFHKDTTLTRVATHGDLFEPLLTLQQELPELG